ncbi:HET-domain-containing protein [Paraphaeosphaeria sporulosa]|uniref:HET-domain-containing protein n=1 Tax=Paraphaeosphaeria sporulosa TaxID=1460663 RepID=A0A177CGQ7_9PLEO|nr:HET-domain-containing protein [Paraphaeosphaeria sporulosa]OAG06763.1 HET-domain-containing protein [Paraphaeosphaeria sporulosa]
MSGTAEMTRAQEKKSLRNKLKAAMVPKNQSDLQFIPMGVLDKLLDRATVGRALEQCKDKLDIDIALLESFICNKARKIFAILTWADSPQYIQQFFLHNFVDEQLPVRVECNDEDLYDAISFRLGKIEIDQHPFNYHQWTTRNVDLFCDNEQWPFLSPVLDGSQFRYDFHERTRMPFVDERHKSLKESFFSVVEQWRIHRDHVRAPKLVRLPKDPNDHPTVAVKKLKQMTLTDAEVEIVAGTEVQALETMRILNHRHLVKAIAYYTRGKSHCIVFPWAHWGNLRDIWNTNPPKLDENLLRWVFTQLCGLADAIKTLHNSQQDSHGRESLRHGDLKPENILCFEDLDKEPSDDISSSILVIADVGLSRSHDQLTEDRKGATRTKSGTIKYEPPETELQPNEPRSRRYDVWSLGCIYLEFMIWLLYGREELEHFRNDLNTLGENTRFYIVEEDTSTRNRAARLNSVVQKWVDWIKKDKRCSERTAIRRLLDLIVERLLVADVGPVLLPRRPTTFIENDETPSTPSVIVRQATFYHNPSNDSSVRPRATAEELENGLRSILEDADSTMADRIEWLDWSARAQPGPRQYGDHLNASDSVRGLEPLNDDWKYGPDTEMANHVLSDFKTATATGDEPEVSTLCERCNQLPIWLPRHTFSDTLADLRARSPRCNLCRLLQKHVQGHTEGDRQVLQFFRVGSSLTFHDRQSSPIVSLYTFPEGTTLGVEEPSNELQFGIPRLHEPGTSRHLKVLSGWIESCDKGHLCVPKHESFLPTRVLEIGNDSKTVRLYCGARGQTRPGKYFALSHRWGLSPNLEEYYRTCRNNVDQHQRGMNVADFPKTFRDAIEITRALGVPYLWIDSLCIIQDDQEDWETESRLMEQVYSNAYATIAASCATGTYDGFLKPRPSRDCLKIKRGITSAIYVCDAIDDFTRDVENGQLNRRGWVLQERALSRRTIYFADRQTYWECSQGVRCETLTKMNNKKASFLGDASFPDSFKSYVKGTKIELFQSLYEKYSTLDLSYPADRPVAIKSLERRMIRTLNTEGGHGVFDIYLHRCLLWQRAGSSLHRIDALRNGDTPSWSWMGYEGSMRYMTVPFGEVLWAEDIHSPWRSAQDIQNDTINEYLPTRIRIIAQACELTDSCKPADFIMDEPSRSFTRPFKFVIVGIEKLKRPGSSHRLIHGLVVAQIAGKRDDEYERVGVATLEESSVRRSTPSVAIQLV